MTTEFNQVRSAIVADVARLREPLAVGRDGEPLPPANVGSDAEKAEAAAALLLETVGPAIEAYERAREPWDDSVGNDLARARVSLAGQRVLHSTLLRIAKDLTDGTPLHTLLLDVASVAATAFQAGRNVGYPEGEAAGVELGERRASSRVVLGESRAERALAWIERNETDGIGCVARALSGAGVTRPTTAAAEALAKVAKATAKRGRKAARRGR